jgi:nucleoside-diphosphate-sugar epimerase
LINRETLKILVIGGTRFVGLRLVRFLESKGHDITLLNRGRTEVRLPSSIKRLYADRREPATVKSALQGKSFEAVFDMTGYQAANLEPILEILEGKVGHYVFQSTCGVYADSEILPVTEDFPYLVPEDETDNQFAYEKGKIECEKFLLKAHRERGFPVTIFRCPFIYGPENWMDEREGSYFARLLMGRKIIVPGNGSTINHFTHVDDLARAYLSVIGKERTLGQAYNIADAEAFTINGYIDTIARIAGVIPQKIHLEPRDLKKLKRSVFPFPWEKNSFFGIQKAKEHFGFWPEYNLKSGMENTYHWWSKEKGLVNIKFIPGKTGYDVDLAYEDEVIQKFS